MWNKGLLRGWAEEKVWEGRNEDGWGEDRGTVRFRYGSCWFHCLDRQFIQLEGPCAVSDGGSEGWSAECVYLRTLLNSHPPLNGRFWHREMRGMRDWDTAGTCDAKCLRLRLFSSFGWSGFFFKFNLWPAFSSWDCAPKDTKAVPISTLSLRLFLTWRAPALRIFT